MSGARSASQAVRFSIRCLTELTFQVAMRMDGALRLLAGFFGLLGGGFARDVNQHARLPGCPKGFGAKFVGPVFRPAGQGVQAGGPMWYRTVLEAGETDG